MLTSQSFLLVTDGWQAAWPVNFAYSLESFEPALKGLYSICGANRIAHNLYRDKYPDKTRI